MIHSKLMPERARSHDVPAWLHNHVSKRGATAFREIQATTARALIVDDDRSDSGNGLWHNSEVHYFDLCLSTRSKPSRGHFVGGGGPKDFGRMFFIPAGAACRVEAGACNGSSLSLFLLPHPLLNDDGSTVDWTGSRLDNWLNIQNDRVHETSLRIAQEVREPGFASALLVEGLALALFAELARMLQASRANTFRKGGLAPWRLRLIQERVRDDPRVPDLVELAALCGLGPRHLMRAFRRETGLTIGKFVQTVAIDRAKWLLTNSDMPIALVAKELGFATAAGFSTAFRRSTGLSPRCYRTAGARG